MSNPEGRKPIPLTAAQQKIYDAFVKALPGLTNREKINLRARIRSGKQKAKDFRGKLLLTDDLFKKEYKDFQKLFKNAGTDSQFATFLNKRYVPRIGDTFTGDGLYAKRKLLGVKSPVKSGVNPTNLQRQADINKFLEKEIAKANAGEKYIEQESLAQKAKKKLNLPKSFGNIKNAPDGYPILGTLETRAEKIDKVLKNLLIEKTPLKQNFTFEILKRTGIGIDALSDNLRSGNVPTYNVIKDQGAEYIRANFGKKFPKVFYTLPFAEQLTYATEMQEGRPTYTRTPKGALYGKIPGQKIKEFALRSWNQNEGQGEIKFYDKKGKLIPWQFGTKLPYTDVSFSYNGVLHSHDDMNDVRHLKKYFPEAYKKINRLNILKNKLVDNPFEKGQIKVQDLVKRIQVEGYSWSPKAPAMDILHGPKGVRFEPFTNLSFNSRDINQLGSGITNAMRTGFIGQRQGQSIIKAISQALPGEETDIIQRQLGLADKIKKGTMFNYKDMSGAIRGLFESVDKPTILQIRRAVGCDNADGGRIELQAGGDLLACPTKKFQNDPVGFTNKVNQIQQPTSGITKFTNAALGFLKSPGVKTFGAGAAIGTAVGLVKLFKNDDPTTYLSNEDQQKSMLVDMATQPVSIDMERPAILDYQLPALGATLAASTAAVAPSTIKASKSRALGIERKPPGMAKTGLRVLGRGLGVAASPAVLAPFAAADIASQIAEGDSPMDIATNPFNYLYPAFADQTPKLTRGLPSVARNIARLGLSRAALTGLSRLGIGGFAAASAIQGLGLLDD